MIQSTSINKEYIRSEYNMNNSQVYVDMVRDMAQLKSGVFTCIFKIDRGNICDYLVIENDTYANFKPTRTN